MNISKTGFIEFDDDSKKKITDLEEILRTTLYKYGLTTNEPLPWNCHEKTPKPENERWNWKMIMLTMFIRRFCVKNVNLLS